MDVYTLLRKVYNPVPKGCPLKPKISLYESQYMEKEKSVVISFRLPESIYEPFKKPVEASGGNRSKFFRSLFIENKVKVVISDSKKNTDDLKKYLHLVNKTSNNLNQLAKLLNGAEKSGLITSKQYLAGLNQLNTIRLLLNSKLSKGD